MGSGDESNESTSEHVQVRRFNESFYSSDPADYLQTRLYLLILAGGKRSELRRLIEEGVEYAGLTVGAKPEDDASDNEGSAGGDREDRQNTDERDWDRFLVVESQQLLHHACETALRMFFVHAAASKVPWVELAAERSFSRFKDRVRAEFIDKEPDPELVAHVCLGRRDPPYDATLEAWAGALEGIAAFLRELARCFLEDANLYNGIKHGLGVSPGDAVLLVDSQQVGFGPSVEYPESGDWEGKSREWSLTTQWIDITQSLALTHVAIQIIDSIWRIGKYRCVGGEGNGNLFFPTTLRPGDLRGSMRPPMRRMSWRLVVEERHRT